MFLSVDPGYPYSNLVAVTTPLQTDFNFVWDKQDKS